MHALPPVGNASHAFLVLRPCQCGPEDSPTLTLLATVLCHTVLYCTTLRRAAPQLRYKLSLLEHSLKAKESEAARLRERLADKVAKEERRLARDKATYAR